MKECNKHVYCETMVKSVVVLYIRVEDNLTLINKTRQDRELNYYS